MVSVGPSQKSPSPTLTNPSLKLAVEPPHIVVERESAVLCSRGAGHVNVACLTASAESVVALREVEARAGKHGSIDLKGCHILGVEVKTVDVAIAAKIKTKKDTPAERLAAANQLYSTTRRRQLQRYGRPAILLAHCPPGRSRQVSAVTLLVAGLGARWQALLIGQWCNTHVGVVAIRAFLWRAGGAVHAPRWGSPVLPHRRLPLVAP